MKTLVTLLVLACASSASSAFAVDLDCGGTEPFWGLSVKGKTLTYRNAGADKAVKLNILTTRQAAGLAENFAFVIKTKYTTASIVRGDCSDGMSDETYSHHILYDVGGTVLYGCCDLAGEPKPKPKQN